jgi:hypothetical protein
MSHQHGPAEHGLLAGNRISIDGNNNVVVVVTDPGCTAASHERVRSEQQWAQAARQAAEAQRKATEAARRAVEAERRWAAQHPYLYSEGGSRAFQASEAMGLRILTRWTALLLVPGLLWAASAMGLPGGSSGGLLATLIALGIVAAFLLIPAVVLAFIPAAIHAAVIDGRAERAAKRRAEPRERAERLAKETEENDRRLRELGIDL